jgi:glycosyltransferase involved in cell wall biosynthesis
MIHNKKVVVVMPAYNAGKTLERTYNEIPMDVVDEIILVDDSSRDRTVEVASRLGLKYVIHPENRGYGGNQKTCYTLALREEAEIIVMLHPDYQYTPRLITPMAGMIASGEFDVVLGSRILGEGPLKGGMPFYKFISNRFLTLAQNLIVGHKLTEYHTGFRAFSRRVLTTLPLLENSDDFIFDNQMLVQVIHFGFKIGELTCPTRYIAESSSINFSRSVKYGFGVLGTSFQHLLTRIGIASYPFLREDGRRLPREEEGVSLCDSALHR